MAAKKIENVTADELDRVLGAARQASDELSEIVVRIGAGYGDQLDEPLRYAAQCLAMLQRLAVATSHFVARARRDKASK